MDSSTLARLLGTLFGIMLAVAFVLLLMRYLNVSISAGIGSTSTRDERRQTRIKNKPIGDEETASISPSELTSIRQDIEHAGLFEDDKAPLEWQGVEPVPEAVHELEAESVQNERPFKDHREEGFGSRSIGSPEAAQLRGANEVEYSVLVYGQPQDEPVEYYAPAVLESSAHASWLAIATRQIKLAYVDLLQTPGVMFEFAYEFFM